MAEKSTSNARTWGAADEELAAYPTVYAEGLMNGQVVVISGGGSGIGRAAAFLFARLGAEVVICGRTEDKLQRVCDAIERLLDKKISYRSLSTRNPEMVDQFISDVWNENGKIDCLVNSAGGAFCSACSRLFSERLEHRGRYESERHLAYDAKHGPALA